MYCFSRFAIDLRPDRPRKCVRAKIFLVRAAAAVCHYEHLHISRVLRQWPDKREAAMRLRLGLSSLYRKIEELGLDL